MDHHFIIGTKTF